MLSLLLSGLFLFSSMSAENLRSNNNLIAMSVILSILVSTKRDQDFLKEWLIPDLEQKIYKMILAYFSCPKARKLKSNSLGKLNYSRNNIGEGNGTPLQYSCLEDPMDGRAWWAAVHGVARSRTRLNDHFHFSLSCMGEGNGNPLQCSCLENPRDRGAWQAAVYGVTQSQTQLK